MNTREFLQNFKKWNYCDYSSDNYGAHSIAVKIGRQTFYYSYDTIVAFEGYDRKGNHYFCIHQNDWGVTTGKHLNAINSDKSIRLNDDEFVKQLKLFTR